MKYYTLGMKIKTESAQQKLDRQLKAAAKGFLMAMREARGASNVTDRIEWLRKAKKFKSFLERLGKNK